MQGLYLSGHEISDLTPLAGLTELTFLALDGNNIEDICPIQDLYLLSRLVISQNQIANIDCLSQLFSLTDLLAGDNLITDITALAHLPLRWLLLDNNRVADINAMIADTGYRFGVMILEEMVFVTVLTESERNTIKSDRMLNFDELVYY